MHVLPDQQEELPATAAATTRKKLVIVGDGACGKTSLLTTFSRGHFPIDYVPTVFENSVVVVQVDEQLVELELWDTAGQEDFQRLRPFSYANADVVLIAFSVDNLLSLENAQQKWIQEVLEHSPDVPILLVGLKTDLRQKDAVSKDMASAVSVNLTALYISHARIDRRRTSRLGGTSLMHTHNPYTYPYLYAIKYAECSSKLHDGVNEVFEHATRAALAYEPLKLEKRRQKSCARCCLC